MRETVVDMTAHPRYQSRLREELAAIDEQLEPLQRRAEEIRRALGLIAVEKGLANEE